MTDVCLPGLADNPELKPEDGLPRTAFVGSANPISFVRPITRSRELATRRSVRKTPVISGDQNLLPVTAAGNARWYRLADP